MGFRARGPWGIGAAAWTAQGPKGSWELGDVGLQISCLPGESEPLDGDPVTIYFKVICVNPSDAKVLKISPAYGSFWAPSGLWDP